MSAQTSLLDLPEIRGPVTTHAERWRGKLRAAVLTRFRGRVVTTDDVWRLIESDPALAKPTDVHANALGPLFQAWDRARATGDYVRSRREGANRNLLTCWTIQ